MATLAIVGGGAAGMLASVFAARRGLEVHLYEKMKRQGKNYILPGRADAI